MELEVRAVTRLTEEIKQLVLVAPGGGALPAFEAGAHIDVRTGHGKRSYSLANDPAERDRYVIAVLLERGGGGGSAWMHDTVEIGDALAVDGPHNHFPLDEGAAEHLLIAGGIGITPILAMGYRLRALGAKAVCHYCTRSRARTAYLEEAEAVFGTDLILHHDGGDPARGIDLERVLADRPDGAALYLCGPGGLIKAARGTAEATGWPAAAVHFELFASAKTVEERVHDAERADAPFEIELARSRLTLEVPADSSILEVLEAHELDCLYVCREGYCETCVVGLLGGRADHRDEIQSDAEKAENERIYICVSRALPGEKLILDI